MKKPNPKSAAPRSGLRGEYLRIMDDHFPDEMAVTFGDQKLVYRKRTWKIVDEDSGQGVEKGLRYGENPGQEAALYELVGGNLTLGECRFIDPGNGLVSALDEKCLIQFGKHPGKTNLTDVDNALNILKFMMDRPCVCIMKHNNPSGVAVADSLASAYERAYMADRIAAMGGAVVMNRAVDRETAELISKTYVEVVAGPDFEAGSVEILAARKNLRIIKVPRMDKLAEYRDRRMVDFKSLIDGGVIVQQSPVSIVRSARDLKTAQCVHQGKKYAVKREPTEKEYQDILFGWNVEQGVTSNSVLYVKDGVTVGIGTGEQDRVGVAQIAAYKAYTKHADALCFRRHGISYYELERAAEAGGRLPSNVSAAEEKEAIDRATREARGGLRGSVMISDAFFPFRDGVDVGIREGVTAICQPGGALRDYEAIEACNEADPPVTMVLTGQRAFKH